MDPKRFPSPQLLNRAGLTLVELSVAMGLAVLVGLGVANLAVQQVKDQNVREKMIDGDINAAFATRAVWNDLLDSRLSFNNLRLQGRNGSGAPADFFAYMPSANCGGGNIGGVPPECQREFALEAPTAQNPSPVPFYLVIGTRERPGFERVDPSLLFTATGAGIQYRGHATAIEVFGAEPFSGTTGTMLRPGRPVAFVSPIEVPTVDVQGRGISSEPRRASFFLGFYDDQSASIAPALTAGPPELSQRNLLNTQHPYAAYTSGGYPLEISNIQEFFRSLPAIGGSSTYGLVYAVDLVRYSIVEEAGSQRTVLKRQKMLGNGWDAGVTLAYNIQRVRFTRASVKDAMMSFQVEARSALGP